MLIRLLDSGVNTPLICLADNVRTTNLHVQEPPSSYKD